MLSVRALLPVATFLSLVHATLANNSSLTRNERRSDPFLAHVDYAQRVAGQIVAPCAREVAAKFGRRIKGGICTPDGMFSDSLRESVNALMQCSHSKAPKARNVMGIAKGILVMAEMDLCKLFPQQSASMLFEHLQYPGEIYDWAIQAVIYDEGVQSHDKTCHIRRPKRFSELQRVKRTGPSKEVVLALFRETSLGTKFHLVGDYYECSYSAAVIRVRPAKAVEGEPDLAMKIADCQKSNLPAEFEKMRTIWERGPASLRKYLPEAFESGTELLGGNVMGYFTMTFTGRTIQHYLIAHRISSLQMKRVISQTFDFLGELNKLGYMHSDLHMNNVVVHLQDPSRLMVIDFEYAKNRLELAHKDYCKGIGLMIQQGMKLGPDFVHMASGVAPPRNLAAQYRLLAKCPKGTAPFQPLRAGALEEIRKDIHGLFEAWLGPHFKEQNEGQPIVTA